MQSSLLATMSHRSYSVSGRFGSHVKDVYTCLCVLYFSHLMFLFSHFRHKRPPIRTGSTFRHEADPRPHIKRHKHKGTYSFEAFFFPSESGPRFRARPPQENTVNNKAEVRERWRGSGGGEALELVPVRKTPGSRGGWTSVPWVLFTFKTHQLELIGLEILGNSLRPTWISSRSFIYPLLDERSHTQHWASFAFLSFSCFSFCVQIIKRILNKNTVHSVLAFGLCLRTS